MEVNLILSEKIKAQVEAFIVKFGGNYSDYNIGIIKGKGQEHIDLHSYTKGDFLFFWDCETHENALFIKRYFQMKGMEKYAITSCKVEDSKILKILYCFKLTSEQKKNIQESKMRNEL